MDSLEFNKIAGGVLVALLLVVGIGKLSNILYAPELPEHAAVETEADAHSDADVGGGHDAPEVSLAALLAGADATGGSVAAGSAAIAMIAAGSVEDGESVARKCKSCHTFDEGGANRVGPNLWNIVDRPIATLADYSYSDAMSAQEGDWTYDRLWTYLMDPRAEVPGTKMAFRGITDEDDLASLILYLRSLSNDPAPLAGAE